MFGKIKRRPADILFSQYLRKLRGYQCEVCGARHQPNSKNLGVSHFFGRANESVRFDEINCDILCNIPCHRYFEEHKTQYEVWKKGRLGDQEFKKLMVAANTYKKKDDALILIWLKNKLGIMEQEKPKKVCIHKMKFPYCSLCFGRQPKKKKETREVIE